MKDNLIDAIKEALLPEIRELKQITIKIESRMEEMSLRIGDTNTQIIELRKEMRETNRRIDNVREELTEKIDETNKRIDNVREELTEKIDLQTARIDMTNRRIDDLSGRIDNLSENVAQFREDFAEFKAREKIIEDILKRVGRLESKVIA